MINDTPDSKYMILDHRFILLSSVDSNEVLNSRLQTHLQKSLTSVNYHLLR